MKMEAQIRMVGMDQIIPNRFQPRLQFDQEELTKLANSIIEHGIIQPLVLRRVGDKFEIIAGERRYKASQMAGISAVPAIITELDDNESAEVAIIENTHRKDLSAIEEAKSYKKLLDRKYITQEQLAKRLGTSQSNIANKIRLLALDEQVQRALMEEKITERHARSLLRVTDKLKQVELLNKVINERWNVRKLDLAIDKVQEEYKSRNDITNRMNENGDYDINSIIQNSQDIGNNNGEYMPKEQIFQYQSQVDLNAKKSKILLNNLENETVNMDTSIGLVNSRRFEDDLDMLDYDDEDEDEIQRIDTAEFHSTDAAGGSALPEGYNDEMPGALRIGANGPQREEQFKSMDDVVKGVKKILINAKYNDVPIDFEEFNFDSLYQIVVKVKKEEK